MQKQSLALGYFFLAVFCVNTHLQCAPPLRTPLLLAALAAGLAGFSIAWGNRLPSLQAIKTWLVQMFWQAQQPPTRRNSQMMIPSDPPTV